MRTQVFVGGGVPGLIHASLKEYLACGLTYVLKVYAYHNYRPLIIASLVQNVSLHGISQGFKVSTSAG